MVESDVGQTFVQFRSGLVAAVPVAVEVAERSVAHLVTDSGYSAAAEMVGQEVDPSVFETVGMVGQVAVQRVTAVVARAVVSLAVEVVAPYVQPSHCSQFLQSLSVIALVAVIEEHSG